MGGSVLVSIARSEFGKELPRKFAGRGQGRVAMAYVWQGRGKAKWQRRECSTKWGSLYEDREGGREGTCQNSRRMQPAHR